MFHYYEGDKVFCQTLMPAMATKSEMVIFGIKVIRSTTLFSAAFSKIEEVPFDIHS